MNEFDIKIGSPSKKQTNVVFHLNPDEPKDAYLIGDRIGNLSFMDLRELLAELEHQQWIVWSVQIAETEPISVDRRERWKKLWRPYSELTEEEKNQDRKWADKVLALLKKEKDSNE